MFIPLVSYFLRVGDFAVINTKYFRNGRGRFPGAVLAFFETRCEIAISAALFKSSDLYVNFPPIVFFLFSRA